MSLLVATVIVGALLLLSLGPLLQPPEAAGAATARKLIELEAERDRLIEALRDVELDRQMGKLTDSDHEELRSSLERRAVEVLAAIEAAGEAEAASESEDAGRAPEPTTS